MSDKLALSDQDSEDECDVENAADGAANRERVMRMWIVVAMLTAAIFVLLPPTTSMARGSTTRPGSASVQHNLQVMNMGTHRRTARNPNYHDPGSSPPAHGKPLFKTPR